MQATEWLALKVTVLILTTGLRALRKRTGPPGEFTEPEGLTRPQPGHECSTACSASEAATGLAWKAEGQRPTGLPTKGLQWWPRFHS